MFVTAESVPERASFAGAEVHESERFLIAWTGFLFRYGARAGAESVAGLARALEHEPLPALCRSLHGAFALFVFDRRTRTWQVAVDNAALYHAFHDERRAGTGFLELIETAGGTPRVSPAAAAEFLAHDGVFWSGTLVDGIRRIGHDEVIELTVGTKIVVRKELVDEPPDEAAFLAHFDHLAEALANRRVSLDLTGGFDSRLVACLLAGTGLDFEAAVVGRPGIPDVVIAERVARALNRPFHLTVHDSSGIEDELDELLRQCDGLADVLAYHRSGQLSAARRKRGVEVTVIGAGGELYKDFWWLQDWPFYRSAKVDFARLYDLRVQPLGLPQRYLAGEAASAYANLRRRTIEGFERHRATTNTESYDNVYFFYKMSQFAGRYMTTNINHYGPVAAPLLDFDNFCFAKVLPRATRSLNRFHRRTLSRECPALAALPTTEGVSASNRSGLADLVGYGLNRGQRLLKKIAERGLQRRWLRPPEASDPGTIGRVRGLKAFGAALDDLKDAGILDPDLAPTSVREVDVGRILTLGLLVRRVGR